jgi:transcriptional regulator with XRE-family HTH domain
MTENRKASMEVRYRVGDNVRKLRKARGLTQEQLGQRCGLCKTYVSNVEQGAVNISLANLEAFANGLECWEEDLLRRGFVRETGCIPDRDSDRA